MPAPQWSLADLELRVRERSDMVNSDFVSSSEIRRFLEAAFQELYAQAVSEIEDALIVRSTATNTVAGTSTYAVPPQMRKLRGIRIRNEYFLSPVTMREVELFDYRQNRGKPRHYWLFNDYSQPLATAETVQLLPTPDGVYGIDFYFIPSIQLEDISESLKFKYLAGYDEFLVISAAIRCKDKEESDCSVLLAEKQQWEERMRKTWTPTDMSEPQRVVSLTSAYRNSLADVDCDEVFS